MKCIILILVRTASTRLHKKALLKIDNTPMIFKLVERLNTVKNSKIIICTTKLKTDNYLAHILKNYHLNVFRGPSKNILKRILLTSLHYNIKECIIVEADDLFCDPLLIEKTYNKMTKTKYDLIIWKNLPFGATPVGLKLHNLGKFIKEKKIKNSDTGWKENLLKSKLFKVHVMEEKRKMLCRPEIRLTVDYQEDYDIAKIIYKNLGRNFSLKDIIKMFDRKPELLNLNKTTQQKYQKNYEKKKQKILNKR